MLANIFRQLDLIRQVERIKRHHNFKNFIQYTLKNKYTEDYLQNNLTELWEQFLLDELMTEVPKEFCRS